MIKHVVFAAALSLTAPAFAQPPDHADADGAGDEHRAPAQSHQHPAQGDEHAPRVPASTPDVDHDDHEAPMASMQHSGEHGGGEAMTALLGGYAMTREASGTSWQPDASRHAGVHSKLGSWNIMSHLTLYGVYDWQDGPRGDEKSFLAGMAMVSAKRNFGADTVTLRAMVSPDPFMGKSGYPLLFASGETADGVTPLLDRQHPHDFLMELSASYAKRFGDRDSVFVYAGLPGEPAFGPPAFMHRQSGVDSPEAPITHHWLDSTHITFGVITAGYIHDKWKLEASQFTGREPDQDRFGIDEPRLDSTALRVSWNPTQNWSLQGSWADMKGPEQLHPNDDETRYSASAIYTRALSAASWVSFTGAWGRKDHGDGPLDAFLLEAAYAPNADWTIFSRAEHVENEELGGADVENFAKLSVGAVRDWKIATHAKIGLGGLYAFDRTPDALDAAYGGDPSGAMAFVRLKVE